MDEVQQSLVIMLASVLLAISSIPLSADASRFYLSFQDPRDCAPPQCGGNFLEALNREKTKCADGTKVDKDSGTQCYVANYDLSNLGLSEGDEEIFRKSVGDGGIVLGNYKRDLYDGDNNEGLADLVVRDGWTPFKPKGTASPPSTCECENKNEVCIDDPNDTCFGCGCPTVCRGAEPILCSESSEVCPQFWTCVDDGFCSFSPLVNCDITAGCTRVVYCDTEPCSKKAGDPCSASLPCAQGQGLVCVDPLHDGCDEACGDEGCGRICVNDLESV